MLDLFIRPQGYPRTRAHSNTARCPSDSSYLQMRLLNFTWYDPFWQLNTILARATLAAASAPRVRVTFPRVRPSPSTCAARADRGPPAPPEPPARRRARAESDQTSLAGLMNPSHWPLILGSVQCIFDVHAIFVIRTSAGDCPLDDREVPVPGSPLARTLVPGAPLSPRPLEDREVPLVFSVYARPFIPGAPLGPRPMEDFEVPAECSVSARLFVPGAPLGPSLFEEREVTAFCSGCARMFFFPGAPLIPRPLEDREVSVFCSI